MRRTRSGLSSESILGQKSLLKVKTEEHKRFSKYRGKKIPYFLKKPVLFRNINGDRGFFTSTETSVFLVSRDTTVFWVLLVVVFVGNVHVPPFLVSEILDLLNEERSAVKGANSQPQYYHEGNVPLSP